MKFNPVTKELFTNEGEFLKRVFCPKLMTWDRLKVNQGISESRNCEICERHVLDTSKVEEQHLISHIIENPDSCLKLNVGQDNLFLTR